MTSDSADPPPVISMRLTRILSRSSPPSSFSNAWAASSAKLVIFLAKTVSIFPAIVVDVVAIKSSSEASLHISSS